MKRILCAALAATTTLVLVGCDPLEGDFLVVANDCDTEILVEVPGVTDGEAVRVAPGRAWSAILYEVPSEPINVFTADGQVSQAVDTRLWGDATSELAVDVPASFCANQESELLATPMTSGEIDERYYDRID